MGVANVEPPVRRRCAAFLGELHTAEVTTTERMWRWLSQLEPREGEPPDATRVDSLCALLTTGGEKLEAVATAEAVAEVALAVEDTEAATADKVMATSEDTQSRLEALFSRLSHLSADTRLDTRLRCLLLDTVELRERGWRPRAHVACPLPIDELRAAAEAEAPTHQPRRRRRRRRHTPVS